MRTESRRGRMWIAVACATTTLFTATGPSRAQMFTRATLIDDYGFTQPLTSSARAGALAGAYGASGNDVHCLVFNPAGLARVTRIEASMALQQERQEVANRFFGRPTSVDRRDGGIDALSVAVPIPTYRGSFVGAFGIYRTFSSYLDLHYSGTNDVNGTGDNYLLQQSGSVYSYNLGLGVDLSPTLAGGFAVFLLDGTIDALEQFDYRLIDADPEVSMFVTNESSLDVYGWGGRVGAQLYVHPLLRFGATFTFPVWMELRGDGVTEVTEVVDNGIDTFTQGTGTIDMEFLLPFRIDLDVAGTHAGVTVSAGMGYADWTQASIDRRRFRTPQTLETVFRDVFDYRLGVEWTLPGAPMRLRAGYARRPYPLKYIQADRIDNSDFVRTRIPDDRDQLAFGMGALVGGAMALDLAFIRTGGERSVDTFTDTRTSDRYLLSVAYRF